MMSLYSTVFVAILLLQTTGLQKVNGLAVAGALSLDSMTFDKVVKSFKSILIKFDNAYPHGEHQEEFRKLATFSSKTEDFIIAEVGINEYGEKENQDLANRYGIRKDNYPQYRLFKGDLDSPISHSGGTTHFEIVRFLRENGIYVGLDGCLERLDSLAEKFMSSLGGQKDTQEAVFNELKNVIENFHTAEEKEYGEMYISIVKNMIGKGRDFVQKNIDRMVSILEGDNVAKNKKEKLQKKVNILKCFSLSAATSSGIKDEL
uniref:endoplasmic reticulum resident protein 29-like n=1 Tax=Styela clava TaxID=7725 RepID=UPI00193ABEE5|nr:endoplasmic reticulum resident protein 29-like [Styela clava]